VDLKYPRQATFVKQANIANGLQHVNNDTGMQGGSRQVGTPLIAQTRTHEKELELTQTNLCEIDHGQPGGWVDTRATQTTERIHQAVEAVESVHRAKKPRG
jgi:hypothetical protein